MPVQFKFRGEKAFRSLLNVTTPCTLQRVKNAIYEQARISDSTTDLALDDASTGQALTSQALLVQDVLVKVIVRRSPIKAGSATPQPLAASVDPGLSSSSLPDEDVAIDRVIEQHDPTALGMQAHANAQLARFSRSYRLAVGSAERQKDGDDASGDEAREPPPANYTCHRCGMTGGKEESHWIWECPTNDDPNHMKKVRTAKGVPRKFLRKVTLEEAQELSAGGVTFTLPGHSGHYIFDHEAPEEEKKMRLGDTVKEKVVTAFTVGATEVESSLKCPLCHQMFRQALLTPCCGATFCSDCILDKLAHSIAGNTGCPGCKREVYAHQLIANEDIRKQVEHVTRTSKATSILMQKEKDRGKTFEMDASLKERVNRPRKQADDPGGQPLALTDQSATASSALVVPPNWQPLGFGPMLSRAHFDLWRQVARSGTPASAKAQFEDWQRRQREGAVDVQRKDEAADKAATEAAQEPAAPHFGLSANGPPPREVFEEWQRTLCDRPDADQSTHTPMVLPMAAALAATSEPNAARQERKERKEKKERKSRRRKRSGSLDEDGGVLATRTRRCHGPAAAVLPVYLADRAFQ